MINPKNWICGVLLLAAPLFAWGIGTAAITAPGKDQAKVVVDLKWDAGLTPTPVTVLLVPVTPGGQPAPGAKALSAIGHATVAFPTVSPGDYRIASREGEPYEFEGTVRIEKAQPEVGTIVQVRKAHQLKVALNVLLGSDDRPVEAGITFWRNEWNKADGGFSPNGKGEVDLKAGQRYWIEVAPVQFSLGKPLVVGPILPEDYQKQPLTMRIASAGPFITCRCSVEGEGRQKPEKEVRLYIYYVDASGLRNVLQLDSCAAKSWDEEYVNSGGRALERFEPVPDGKYKIEAEARQGDLLWLATTGSVDFDVTKGKANPASVSLKLSPSGVATLRLEIKQKQGGPLAGALVQMGKGGAVFQQCETDKKGIATLPPVHAGEQEIDVSVGGTFVLKKTLNLKGGLNEVSLDVAAPETVRGQVLDSTGKPCQMEVQVSSLGTGELLDRSGNADGGFECKVPPDAYPLFILAAVPKPRAEVAVILDQSQAGPVKLRAPAGPSRQIHAEFPTAWLMNRSPQPYLWISPKGSVCPVAVIPLRPNAGSGEGADPKKATRKEERVIVAGKYSLLVQFGQNLRSFWNAGEITVLEKAEGPLEINLEGKVETVPLSELRKTLEAGK